MIRSLFLPLLFASCVVIETSLLQPLPRPFSLVPLVFVVGVVLLHRVGIIEGVVWFILTGLLGLLFGFNEPFFWHAFILAGIGAFLTKQTFAHRSLYALLALGGSLFISERILRIVSIEIAQLFSKVPELSTGRELTEIPRDLVVLLLSLYVAYLTARYVEFLLRKVFYLR